MLALATSARPILAHGARGICTIPHTNPPLVSTNTPTQSGYTLPRIPEIYLKKYEFECVTDHAVEIERLTYKGPQHCAFLPLSEDVADSYRSLVLNSMQYLARLGNAQQRTDLYSHVNNLIDQGRLLPTEAEPIIDLLLPVLNANVNSDLDIENLTYLEYQHYAFLPLSHDVADSDRALIINSMLRIAQFGGMQERNQLYSHVNDLIDQGKLFPNEAEPILELLVPYLNATITSEWECGTEPKENEFSAPSVTLFEANKNWSDQISTLSKE